MITIAYRVREYIAANPCSTVAAMSQALDLDVLQVSGACKALKKRGLADYQNRFGRASGRYVVWFMVEARPTEDLEEARYQAFIPVWQSRETHKEMRERLHCSSETLQQWIVRARAEGVEQVSQAPAPERVRKPQQPKNMTPKPYHPGWSWTARP